MERYTAGMPHLAALEMASIISAILNASHCNSSHENRDKKEVPYGFHHYLLWFCRSKHDRALSLQMA